MTPPFNPFRIDWNTCTFGQWEALLSRCKRPTLLQTWQYAMAHAKTEGGKADFGKVAAVRSTVAQADQRGLQDRVV